MRKIYERTGSLDKFRFCKELMLLSDLQLQLKKEKENRKTK